MHDPSARQKEVSHKPMKYTELSPRIKRLSLAKSILDRHMFRRGHNLWCMGL